MKRNFILFIYLLSSFIHLFANSDHQRMGVEKEVNHKLSPSIGLNISTFNSEGTFNTLLDGSLSLSYRFKNIIGVEFSQSFLNFIQMPLTDESIMEIGDLGVNLVLFQEYKDIRFSERLGYTYPLGTYQNYTNADYNLISSDGYHKPRIELNISKIIDPTFINFSIGYTAQLFKEMQFKTVSKLGILQLSLGITEVLNDKLGYNINISNNYFLPETDFKNAKWSDTYNNISFSFIVFYYIDKLSFNTGIKNNINQGYVDTSTSLNTTYDFDF